MANTIKTISGPATVDTSMLPYYCDGNGVYLSRKDIYNPDIMPHVLLRVRFPLNNNSCAVIVNGRSAWLVDGNGNRLDVDIDYSDAQPQASHARFLGEIKATCAFCGDMVGPPGSVERSGKWAYQHISCAYCAAKATPCKPQK